MIFNVKHKHKGNLICLSYALKCKEEKSRARLCISPKKVSFLQVT